MFLMALLKMTDKIPWKFAVPKELIKYGIYVCDMLSDTL